MTARRRIATSSQLAATAARNAANAADPRAGDARAASRSREAMNATRAGAFEDVVSGGVEVEVSVGGTLLKVCARPEHVLKGSNALLLV